MSDRFTFRIKRIQKAIGAVQDGIIGNEVLTLLEEKLLKESDIKKQSAGVKISKAALKLIVDYETGGERYYKRTLQRPTWPAYASGVTIGFGYDLGYHSKTQIERDWGEELSKADIEKLKTASGVKGKLAKSLANRLARSGMTIPWATGQRVFNETTLPRQVALTVKAFPESDELPPHLFGVLVSLVFNRGASMSGSRRAEMKEIRTLIANRKNYDDKELARRISDQIKSMRRLWKDNPRSDGDLYDRRTDEAKLVTTAFTDLDPDSITV